MPTFLFSNPYNPDGESWAELQKITGRVSPTDWAYLHRLCGFRQGHIDKVVATLFHSFINELRTLESTSTESLEPAFCSNHPTEHIVAGVLSRCNFRDASLAEPMVDSGLPGSSVGESSSAPREGLSPQPLPGPTHAIHPEVLRSTLVRSKQESGSD